MAGAQKSRVVVSPLSRNSACENCRMRKIRCSGDRNGCEACKKMAKNHNIDVSQLCSFPSERASNNRKKSSNGEDKSDQTLSTPSNSRQRRGSSAETSYSDNSTPESSLGSTKEFEHFLASPLSSPSSPNYTTANPSPLDYHPSLSDYHNLNFPAVYYPISLFDPLGGRQILDIDQSPNRLHSDMERHRQDILSYLNERNSSGDGYQPQSNQSSEEYRRQMWHTLLEQSRQQQSDDGNRLN